MYGCKKMTRRPAYRMRHIQFLQRGPLRWWDLSVLHGQNIMTALGLSFILTINVFPLIRGRKGQIEDETEREGERETERNRTGKQVTSCVNFYSNSFEGYIKLYHNIQPPWNNLYANKALHMVWAVCISAGKIFYVVSEFCGSQMFFNL